MVLSSGGARQTTGAKQLPENQTSVLLGEMSIPNHQVCIDLFMTQVYLLHAGLACERLVVGLSLYVCLGLDTRQAMPMGLGTEKVS